MRKNLLKSIIFVLVLSGVAWAAGSWNIGGYRYTPQLTTQGTTDYNQIVISEQRTNARLGASPYYNGATTIAGAITNIGSTAVDMIVPAGSWAVSDNLTIPANVYLRVMKGATITVAAGKTLTINGPFEAGIYPVFSLTGTTTPVSFGSGSVAATIPQWFGAVGDDSTDCTAALNAAEAATPVGGTIKLVAGSYKTTGWLITKTLSLVADTPFLYGSGSYAATLKAAGNQAYVVEFQGTFSADASTFLHPRIRNINIDGDNKTISDAALIMEYCHLADSDGMSVQNSVGTGLRILCMWDSKFRNYFIHRCGVLDTGQAVLLDGVSPLDYTKSINALVMEKGTWSSNKGTWLKSLSLANIDAVIFRDNKLELDDLTILNTVSTNVIKLGSAARTMILNNMFASFGTSYGKYTNLIWIGGQNDDSANGAAGAPGNEVRGNRYYGQDGSGAINGLYLAQHAAPVTEMDNVSTSNTDPVITVPNVNVSEFHQLIDRAWLSFSTTLFLYYPMPNRESGNYISPHKMSHGAHAAGAQIFIADSGACNNSMTVMRLTAANQVTSEICQQIDMSKYIGYPARNIVVRARLKLDAAGSVTVYCNGVAPGSYDTYSVVNQTGWTWYEFVIPTVQFTTTNHFLDIYYWQVNSGTANVLVDGVEFGTSEDNSHDVTTGVVNLETTGISRLDSSGGAITGTMPDGTVTGQRVRVTMIDATTSSTLSVTTHATSNPEVFTFATLGATLVLEWDGTQWITISNYGATT